MSTTVVIEVPVLTGFTGLVGKLYPSGSGTCANNSGSGDALTESTNGVFSMTVTDSLTGLHTLVVEDSSGNPLASEPVKMATSGTVVASMASYLTTLISGVGGQAGTGATSKTLTFTITGTSTPIQDADVWLTTDEAGENVFASGRTDSNGQVTFLVDLGDQYYKWLQKGGVVSIIAESYVPAA